MNRIDRAVIAALVLVLAFAAFAIGGPAFGPTSPPGASADPTLAPTAPYREGILGRPTNVNPLAARTQADRDLVALVFEGLVARDAQGRPAPGLAASWSMADKGATWTFELRPGARWQDGRPVTSADVAFTVATLQDPEYHGPGAGSWAGIKVTAPDPATVRFELATPIGGFLDLATQPIVPEHLLGTTPVADLADDPFGEGPVGSGPYQLVELDRDHAVLEIAEPAPAPGVNDGSASDGPSLDPLATARPTPRPTDERPDLSRLELRFFDDPAVLADAFRKGELDAVSGLDPAAAAELAATPGARTLRYPSTTVASVLLNLRPANPTVADPKVRRALLQAIDRARILTVGYGGLGLRADGLIPPTSWAFDASASPVVTRDLKAATKALTDAGWTKAKDGWHRPKVKAAEILELLVPDRAANPILFAVGSQVAADWKALGFTVEMTEVDPAVLATDHLRTGDFEAAVVDVAIGHDPDLYPLLASTQTQTGGANVIGLQDPALDDLLEAARAPGAEAARIAAFKALQVRLAGGTYVLPIAWPDRVIVVGSRVDGPVVREVADGSERFGDVLTWRLADDR